MNTDQAPDMLCIEIPLDDEIIDALSICSIKHADLNFARMMRLLLVEEALRVMGPRPDI